MVLRSCPAVSFWLGLVDAPNQNAESFAASATLYYFGTISAAAMKIPPIETEEDYDHALARLAVLIDAPKGSSEAVEREALLEAIEDYEDLAHPFEPL